MKISEAQKLVREFATKSGRSDDPTIDKFDHVHEELIEMSRLIRYKNLEERKLTVKEKHDEFEDGIGDLLFVSLRLANQLGVDAEEAFRKASESIVKRYGDKKEG